MPGIGTTTLRYRGVISPVDRFCGPEQTAEMVVTDIALLGPLSINGDSAALSPRDRVVLAVLAIRPGEVASVDARAV